jgi:hypothetical protein
MDGYSPKLQEVYPLAVPRQRTGYSDSHLLDVEVVQLPDRHGRADQTLGQVELAKRTSTGLIGRRPTKCIPPGIVSILLLFYRLARTCNWSLSRKMFRLMRASRMDLMTFAEALEAFARLS